MALQLVALRDALLAADVPPDVANRAAEEVAGFENRITDIRGSVAEIKGEIAGIRSELSVIRWILAILIGGFIGTYALLFRILEKLT